MESFLINNSFVALTVTNDGMIATEGDTGMSDGTMVDSTMGTGVEGKDPLLSSWPFVIGITTAVLLVSVALGALLAKRKIKKGIDLYED